MGQKRKRWKTLHFLNLHFSHLKVTTSLPFPLQHLEKLSEVRNAPLPWMVNQYVFQPANYFKVFCRQPGWQWETELADANAAASSRSWCRGVIPLAKRLGFWGWKVDPSNPRKWEPIHKHLDVPCCFMPPVISLVQALLTLDCMPEWTP